MSAKITDITLINAHVQQYNALRIQSSSIKAQMDKLSALIKDHVSKYGSRDDKGSFYDENEQFIWGKQAKKSVKFDTDKAIAYFKEHGMEDAVTTVEVIDESAVERYIASDVLTQDALESITKISTSYSIYVKEKDVLPEVQQVTAPLPVAASKKPKLTPKGLKTRK